MSAEVIASLQSDNMAVEDLIEAAMGVLIGDMAEGIIDEAVWITGDEACEQAAIEAAIRIAEAMEAERIRQVCHSIFTLTIFLLSTHTLHRYCTGVPSHPRL